MNKLKSDCSEWAAGNAKNTTRLGIWTLAWVASTAVAAFGPKLVWDFHTGLTVIAVLLNLGLGAGMILATKQHVRGMDELQQRIFLDAGALSLGVGLVCGISYELLEDNMKLISFQPEIGHLIMLMALTFLVGMITGHRKYR